MNLTAEQLEELHWVLRVRREALAAEAHAGAERSREEDFRTLAGSVGDTGDEAVADVLADLEHAEISRDVNELREIDAALARIDAGSYGDCIDCRQPIDFERLLANPTARRCIDCQIVHEKTYVQPPRSTL